MTENWKQQIARLARLVAEAANEPTPGLAKQHIEDLAPRLRELLDALAAADRAASRPPPPTRPTA